MSEDAPISRTIFDRIVAKEVVHTPTRLLCVCMVWRCFCCVGAVWPKLWWRKGVSDSRLKSVFISLGVVCVGKRSCACLP